jgi:hypothetical protein
MKLTLKHLIVAKECFTLFVDVYVFSGPLNVLGNLVKMVSYLCTFRHYIV